MTDQATVEQNKVTHLNDVTRYYRTTESRLGYSVVLRGTKHFGYYRPGDPAWRLGAAMRRMEDLMAARLDLPAGARVLDAGCGVGDVATRLASVHGLDVTGIDILDFNLAEARRRAIGKGVSGQTRFFAMDYARLDFPDRHFDGAYTMETLVHSDHVEQVLAGLHRVLRPGGRLVHFEYSREPAATTTPEAARVLSEVNRAAAMPAFQRLEHGVLEQLLSKTGFIDVRTEDITRHMLPMLKVFAVMGWPTYTAARLLGRRTHAVNAMSGVEFYRHQSCWRYQVYTCRKA
jgi:sterol 24-C-methyltransferase